MNIPIDADEVQRVAIERLKIAVAACVDLTMLELDVLPDAHVDVVARSLVMRLAVHLSNNKIHREVVRSRRIPRTWWDAFKLRWFPRWAIRRWPAREDYVEEVVEFVHVCPHMPMNRSPYSRGVEHLMFLKPPDR